MKDHINDAYSSIRTLNYSVPQESASDANLFTAYCAPIESVIPAGITINGFADNHSIRKPFNADNQDQESQSILLLMDMIANIASWMVSMHLKLNPDNTEFIMFGYRSQLVKCTTSYVIISDSTIPKSPSVKYLGVTLDENLNLKEHILSKCRKAMANFVRIHNICKYLKRMPVHLSPEPLYQPSGLCKYTILWTSQQNNVTSTEHTNNVHKTYPKKSKFDSTREALAQLYWLPIKQRIDFK